MTGVSAENTESAQFVRCRELRKKYGHIEALRGVDLTIRKGEFLSIFGPNGAGKTTLVKILGHLVRPTSGEVTLAGKTSAELDESQKRRVGYISHQSFLYADLTARENLEFYAKLYDVADISGTVESKLADVGLADRRNDLVRGFSRGMLQRLSIARALLADPDLLFLDEPFTGLDQHSARMLKNLLSTLHARERTIVMITHNLQMGLELGSHAAVVVAGKLAHHGAVRGMTPAELEKIYMDAVEGGKA